MQKANNKPLGRRDNNHISTWETPRQNVKKYTQTNFVYFLLTKSFTKHMSMKWVKGRTNTVKFPKAASTVFAANSLVYFDGSGAIIPADATSGDHIGIILQAIAATDSDYASTTEVLVEVPVDKQCEFEADVDGTLTAALVGTTMDLTDASNVNQAATSKNVVTCTKFIASDKGRFVLNSTFDVANVATT